MKKMQSFRDISAAPIKFDLVESSDVDGEHILAKVRGEFFVPNGTSRNKRFYSRELWEKQLAKPELQEKLRDRRMLGTIGHDQALDDQAALDGKISHFTTKLWIENGKGMGEALIMNTPAGRLYNTYARSGVKFFVSTRANGTFDGEENGVPKVDESTYEILSVDMVMDPGFLQANPKVVESFNELNNDNQQGENTMPVEKNALEGIVENLSSEKAKLVIDLDNALKEVEMHKNENTSLVSENKSLKDNAGVSEADVKSIKEKLAKTELSLKEYQAIGTPAEINKVMEVSEKNSKEYASVGTAKSIKETFARVKRMVSRLSGLGSIKTIEEALVSSDKTLTSYARLGTVDEVKKVIATVQSQLVVSENNKKKNLISKLAAELNVSEGRIQKLVERNMNESEIKEVFADVEESVKISNTYTKQDDAEVVTKKDEKFVSIMDKSSGARLMESLSR